MKQVSPVGLPTIDDLLSKLPKMESENYKYNSEDKERLSEYLKKLSSEYKNNIKGKLYTLNPKEDTPDFFTVEFVNDWYFKHIRPPRKGFFEMFPTVKNHNNHEICPFCEGVFTTKVSLEHIIPKNKNNGIFHYTVLPINLVKCCLECNTPKHSKKSDCKENCEIHPYEESFNIDKYLIIEFKVERERFVPKVNFNFKDSDFDKRIRTFIRNYNIEKTYNHRIQLEYDKILMVLAKNFLPLRKSLLLEYLRNQKETYEKYREIEKKNKTEFMINQNYFGYKICKKLLDMNDEFSGFIEELKKINNNSNELAMSNCNFLEELNEVENDNDLENFLMKNEADLRMYYKYRKKNNLQLTFPNLYISDIDKRDVLISVLKYYLENNKEFYTFKKNCNHILY